MGNEQEYAERLARIKELERDDNILLHLMMRSNDYDFVRSLRRLRAVILEWQRQLGVWND